VYKIFLSGLPLGDSSSVLTRSIASAENDKNVIASKKAVVNSDFGMLV